MAIAQCIADARGGEGRMTVAIIRHLLDDGDTEMLFGTHVLQGLRRALAALAKMEVIARDHMGNLEPLHQDFQHELLR